MRVVLTTDARIDLNDILLYTEQRWGRAQRIAYRTTIRNAIATIGRNPNIEGERDGLPTGLRTYPAGRHVIYYRVRSEMVEIVRILHQRMDPVRHV
jgi:toxin ParE1/3/4